MRHAGQTPGAHGTDASASEDGAFTATAALRRWIDAPAQPRGGPWHWRWPPQPSATALLDARLASLWMVCGRKPPLRATPGPLPSQPVSSAASLPSQARAHYLLSARTSDLRRCRVSCFLATDMRLVPHVSCLQAAAARCGCHLTRQHSPGVRPPQHPQRTVTSRVDHHRRLCRFLDLRPRNTVPIDVVFARRVLPDLHTRSVYESFTTGRTASARISSDLRIVRTPRTRRSAACGNR